MLIRTLRFTSTENWGQNQATATELHTLHHDLRKPGAQTWDDIALLDHRPSAAFRAFSALTKLASW